MRAHAAAPVLRIVIGTRQQFAGARRLDHGDRAVGPRLRLHGVEGDEHVQALAGVGVERGEDRWMFGNVQVALVEPDLRGILWVSSLDAVTLERLPAFGT